MIGYAVSEKKAQPVVESDEVVTWQCPQCRQMNPHEVGRCVRCAAKKPL